MYAYDYSVHSIPRCHYKWAGIKRVEPISRVRFNPISSYKEPGENVRRYRAHKPKLEKKVPHEETSCIVGYTNKGVGVKERKPPTLDIYC